jgi:hypothetical protein
MESIVFKQFYLISILIIGCSLIFTSFQIDKNIKSSECLTKNLILSNKGVLVVGLILAQVSGTYVLIHSACKNTQKTAISLTQNRLIACSGFSLILGIVLITLGSIIDKESKKCKLVKSESKTVWGLGVFITSLSAACLGVLGFNRVVKKPLIN